MKVKENVKIPLYFRPVIAIVSFILLFLLVVLVLGLLSIIMVVVPIWLLFVGNVTITSDSKESLDTMKKTIKERWEDFKTGR